MVNVSTFAINGSMSDEIDNRLGVGVVRLLSWPDLAKVPAVAQPLVARICALLSRKLSAARMIPLVLSAPESDVFKALSMLIRHGHVSISGGDLTSTDATRAVAASAETTTTEAAQVEGRSNLFARRSLVGKLWAKLSSFVE